MKEEPSDLITHLSELRTRLIRVIIYCAITMIGAWIFFDPIYRFIVRPILTPLQQYGGELTVRMLLEGLLVKVEIVAVVGFIVALPFILYEVWAFIAPGLTPNERKAVAPLLPVVIILFLIGVTMGYFLTGPTVTALLRFIPPETAALLTLNDTILLLLKFYLAFGLGFQLPVILVVLAKLGIIDSRLLVSRWREAVILIFLAAAIITPTWDPITLTIAAVPMVGLYLGTIAIIRVIERRERRRQAKEGEA